MMLVLILSFDAGRKPEADPSKPEGGPLSPLCVQKRSMDQKWMDRMEERGSKLIQQNFMVRHYREHIVSPDSPGGRMVSLII